MMGLALVESSNAENLLLSMQPRSTAASLVRFEYESQRKAVLVYEDIPQLELHQVLLTAFNLGPETNCIRGICDTTSNVNYPLSLMVKSPSYFARGSSYRLIVEEVPFTPIAVDTTQQQEFYSDIEGTVESPHHPESTSFHLQEWQEWIEAMLSACPTGVLDTSTFEKRISSTGIASSAQRLMLQQLFDVFDTDSQGIVDVVSYLSGMSVLVNESTNNNSEKTKTAFGLYDIDGDGYLTLEEMTSYLVAVFTVIASLDSETTLQDKKMDPKKVGQVTAKRCFVEADLNSDGKVSFEEFEKWYDSTSNNSTTQRRRSSSSTNVNAMSPLERLRNISGLVNFTAEDMFGIFSQACESSGELSFTEFTKCFDEIFKVQGSSIEKSSTAATRNHVVYRLFKALDNNNNGFVDFSELASGLSILCGGTQFNKVSAAFSLFDLNGDGKISMEEMKIYLSSVYKVLFEASNETRSRVGISAEELARVTTEQAFADADVNANGQLEFNEFMSWYSSSSGMTDDVQDNNNVLIDQFTLSDVRHLTTLESRNAKEVIALFAVGADDSGELSKSAFNECFASIIGEVEAEMNAEEKFSANLLIKKLFDIFDINNDGKVDFVELSSGISILCGGSEEEKVRSAFEIYDLDHNGFISPEELGVYLTAVFRILYGLNSTLANRTGVSPSQLAAYTTKQAFADADINQDGQLSYKEFRKWYRNTMVTSLSSCGSSAVSSGNSGLSAKEVPATPDSVTTALRQARVLTNLNAYDAQDIMQFFKASADSSGTLTVQKFFRCFNKLMSKTSSNLPRRYHGRRRVILQRLFQIFDADGNGVVDIAELGAGLSLLCGGSADEKAMSAFALYDLNEDGFISLEEMTQYLGSIFKVLYESSPQLQGSINASSMQLAAATARKCFADCDVNRDGKLSVTEFRSWYHSVHNQQLDALPKPSAPDISSPISFNFDELDLKSVRKLLNLQDISVDELFDKFATYADLNGNVSKESFLQSFSDIIKEGGNINIITQDQDCLISELFDVFDQDKDGNIDFQEMTSGLSVLCSGSRDSKVRSVFSLYDYNGDQFISLDEMSMYLTSIFRVLFKVTPAQFASLETSPEALGASTAAEAFKVADLNKDGRLSFEEFSKWYRNPEFSLLGTESEEKYDDDIICIQSLEEVKRLTNLESYAADDVFEFFAELANEDGNLTRESFNKCFRRLVQDQSGSMSDTDRQKASVIIDRIFEVFDQEGSGVVDFSELSSGLSVLCGGTREDKVKAAFALFDFNGDGYISLPEMQRYLVSVFRILYEIAPKNQNHHHVSAEELATVTAEQAFKEADTNMDGKISIDEFQSWYQNPSSTLDLSPESGGENLLIQSQRCFSLHEAKRLTNLENFSPMEVFERFAERADGEGCLSKESFFACFRELINVASLDQVDEDRLDLILDRLFTIFDTDKNGFVDFSEISSGLSVLCGGNRDEKVHAAFELYDFNGDGFISLDEMTRYLVSVFRVLHETNPKKLEDMGVSPEELGAVTAEQAFEEADNDRDGKINFEEFSSWYSQSNASVMSQVVSKAVPDWWSLEEIRRLTKLESMSSTDVFEALANAANEDGCLTREKFYNFFETLVFSSNQVEKRDPVDLDRLRVIVTRLFELFDDDKNGMLDFSELASGLSVLCGGSREDKVKAAFDLYDYNGDGYISQEEMTRYLISVFKVLYETSDSLATRVGVNAEELGRVTAEQAFVEADSDNDGRLSYEEFQHWYIQPGNQSMMIESVLKPSDVTMDMIRKFTRLDLHDAPAVFEVLAGESDSKGCLSRQAFNRSFAILYAKSDVSAPASSDATLQRIVLDRLFEIFDRDGNGVVDFSELSSGVSILCGGDREEKIRAAFELYDLNGDGLLSRNEMHQYLDAVLHIIYETNPEGFDRIGASVPALARAMTNQCFQAAGLVNPKDKLSFEGCLEWCTKNADGMLGDNVIDNVVNSPVSRNHNATASVPEDGEMSRVQELLRLDILSVEDAFAIFSEQAPSGQLTLHKFQQCFYNIITLTGGAHFDKKDADDADILILKLFEAFDTNDDRIVDFSELASGISVLTASSMDEKLQAAFKLYDVNNDGFISLNEMISYMASVFRVMFETSSKTRESAGVSPEELAEVTATQCFEDADLNSDGKLSFTEFKNWCTESFPNVE